MMYPWYHSQVGADAGATESRGHGLLSAGMLGVTEPVGSDPDVGGCPAWGPQGLGGWDAYAFCYKYVCFKATL